jgi:hypothetical protein
MIFAYPKLAAVDQEVLGMIREQREALRFQVSNHPTRWHEVKLYNRPIGWRTAFRSPATVKL